MAHATVNLAGVPTRVAINTSFDPYEQPFTLIAPDGHTEFQSNISQIQLLIHNVVTQGIIYGTQVGASLIMAILLMLMTRREKRCSWVFILNTMALLFDAIRSILQCAQLNSALYNFYNFEAVYYAGRGVDQAQATSVAAGVFTLFTIICIEASLVLQIHIVCVTLTRFSRSMVTFGSIVVAMLACGFRLALTVINTEQTIGVGQSNMAKLDYLSWMASSSNITLVTSISFFSLIFCIKLAWAIRDRVKLGLKQFGPMQIIFIMGCQTLIVPLVFAIITYYCVPNAQINSFVGTVVALFLPLSGMWASANLLQRASMNNDHRHVPFSDSAPSNGAHDQSFSTDKQHLTSNTRDTLDTLVGSNNNTSVSSSPMRRMGTTRRSTGRRSVVSDVDVDLEMQQVVSSPKTIQVDRTYSVQSDRELRRACGGQ